MTAFRFRLARPTAPSPAGAPNLLPPAMNLAAQTRLASRPVRGVALLAVLSLAFALAACDRDADPAETASVKPPPDPMVVQVTAQMDERFKVAKLATAEIAAVQEVTGRIEASERRVSRIGAAVTGRVTDARELMR